VKKVFAPLIIITIVIVGAGAAIVLTPSSHNSVQSVRASSGFQEYSVTFQTIDGVVLTVLSTVDGRVPVEYIPNAPELQHRPFLRWTNIQGFSLDGQITANITFLPLYSYDPQWNPNSNGNGTSNNNGGGGHQGKNEGPKKTQWIWMNYILDENTIILGSIAVFTIFVFLVFIFLRLLRGVFHK